MYISKIDFMDYLFANLVIAWLYFEKRMHEQVSNEAALICKIELSHVTTKLKLYLCKQHWSFTTHRHQKQRTGLVNLTNKLRKKKVEICCGKTVSADSIINLQYFFSEGRLLWQI